jgi:hypothetical protein
MEEGTGVFDSVKRAAIERINNPVSGTFCLAWVACNWKFIIVLFAEMGVSQTFNYVDKHLYDSLWAKPYYWIIAPGVLTVVFLSVVPLFGLLVFTYNGWLVEWRRRIKLRIERESVLTAKQAAGIWQARVEERERHAQEVERLHKLLVAAGVEVPVEAPVEAPVEVKDYHDDHFRNALDRFTATTKTVEPLVKNVQKWSSRIVPRLELDSLSEALITELMHQGGLMPQEALFKSVRSEASPAQFHEAVSKLMELGIVAYIGTFDKDGGRMIGITDEGFKRQRS